MYRFFCLLLTAAAMAACPAEPQPGSQSNDPVGGDPATCTVACDAGEPRCDDGVVMRCDASGSCPLWVPDTTCTAAELCVDRTCLPATCTPGETAPCVADDGCLRGIHRCGETGWGRCLWEQSTSSESCDGLDNDCNGLVDDVDDLGPCTLQVGVCAGSTVVCEGTPGASCDAVTYAAHAAANGQTYEEGEETLCDGTDNDCDGVVDEMRDHDPSNCGACGRTCTGGFGCAGGDCVCDDELDCDLNETCAGGMCVCAAGFHDCGACVPDDALASCGTSCTACPTDPNGTATCDGTSCGVTCDPGYHDCGACVSDDAPATCGTSCSACPSDSHGTATCDGTSCGITCDAGFYWCVDACIPDDSCGTCLPCAPTGLTATPGDGQVSLSWGLPSTGAPDSYRIYWNTTGSVSETDAAIDVAGSPYLHGGLTNGQRYYYAVSAIDSRGESPLSGEQSAVPTGQVTGFSVRGVVTGLFGTGLGIQLNGGDTQVISSDGAFSFTTTVPDGNSYSVTVSQQPTDPVQSCAVAGGSGTVSGADISDVEVFCSLQIATFNLLFFDAGNPTTKKQAIADIVTNAGFDFVGLQEVNNSTDLGAWVSAYLGASAWGWGTGTSADGLQVGYIYRKRVLSVSGAADLDYSSSSGTIDETAYPWYGLRLPLEVTLSIAGTGDTVSVLVNHLKCCTDSSACGKRAAQVQDIADWLAATAPAQQFIIGDLNDEIASTGICTSVDTLSPLESDTGIVFLTEQPTYMSSSLYTNIPYTSTIDHIIATSDLFGRLYDVDGSGHKGSVVMHGDETISDHQPAYIHLAPQ